MSLEFNPKRFEIIPNAQARSAEEQAALMEEHGYISDDERYAQHWQMLEAEGEVEEADKRRHETLEYAAMDSADTSRMFMMAEAIANLRRNGGETQALRDKEDKLQELLESYFAKAENDYARDTERSEDAYAAASHDKRKNTALEQGIAAEQLLESRKEMIDFILGVMGGDIQTINAVRREGSPSATKFADTGEDVDNLTDPKRSRDKFLPGAVEDAMDKVPAPEQPEDGESEAARNAKEAAKEAAKAVDERDTAQAAADAAAAESATADASGSAEAQPDDNDEHAPATDEQETGKKRFKRIRKLGRGALNFALGNGKKGIALASSMRQKHQAKKAAKIDAILAKDKELIADDDKKTPLTGRPSFSYRMGATSHPIVAQYKEAKKAYKKDKREAKPSLYDKFVDRFADKVPKQEDKHEEVPQYVDDAPTGSFPAQKPDQQPVYTNIGDGQSIDYADQTTQPLPNNVPVSGEQAGSTDGTRAA